VLGPINEFGFRSRLEKALGPDWVSQVLVCSMFGSNFMFKFLVPSQGLGGDP
uniref:Uncharacterized protein n=1 Tax=Cannabis sativa TaxID=3483 RepID=A0A803QS01_CANSA